MTDREKIQAKEAEDNEESTDGAGYDRSRNVELEVDEKATEDQQEAQRRRGW